MLLFSPDRAQPHTLHVRSAPLTIPHPPRRGPYAQKHRNSVCARARGGTTAAAAHVVNAPLLHIVHSAQRYLKPQVEPKVEPCSIRNGRHPRVHFICTWLRGSRRGPAAAAFSTPVESHECRIVRREGSNLPDTVEGTEVTPGPNIS